jgi:peroxiredoxin Q/BCP
MVPNHLSIRRKEGKMVKGEAGKAAAGESASGKTKSTVGKGTVGKGKSGEAKAPAALATASAPAASPAGEMLAEGDTAPAFALPDDRGTTVSLASFAGKTLVLYFYPKDDTSGCTKEAIDLEALRSDLEAKGARILGASPDSVASHAKFKTKHNLGFTLVSDEAKAMLAAYGVWVEKSMYGRKYMGVERTTFLIGPDGRIAKVWRKVKVPGHAAAVLAAVEAL